MNHEVFIVFHFVTIHNLLVRSPRTLGTEPSTSRPGRGACGQTRGGWRGLPHTRDSLTGCWKETLKLESVRGHTSNCRSPAASEENSISEQGLCWPSMHQETRPHHSFSQQTDTSLLTYCRPTWHLSLLCVCVCVCLFTALYFIRL